MNDELQFTDEELESMADKLIEEAAGTDIASQQETEIVSNRKHSPKKKDSTVDNRPPEERLKELLEKGKKAGKLTAKDLDLLNEPNISAEVSEAFYEELEKQNIEIDYGSDDLLPPPDDDLMLELEDLSGVETVPE